MSTVNNNNKKVVVSETPADVSNVSEKALRQVGVVVLGAGMNKEWWMEYCSEDKTRTVIDHDSYIGIYQ